MRSKIIPIIVASVFVLGPLAGCDRENPSDLSQCYTEQGEYDDDLDPSCPDDDPLEAEGGGIKIKVPHKASTGAVRPPVKAPQIQPKAPKAPAGPGPARRR